MTSFAPTLNALAFMSVVCLLFGCDSGTKPVPKQDEVINGKTEPAAAAMSADKLREAINLHNRGLGHLENQEWSEAEAALSKLQTLLPENVDISQNLAVERTLSLISRSSPFSLSKDPKTFNEAIEKAKAANSAFQKLATTDRQKSVAALIAGKLAVFEDNTATQTMQSGLDLLKEAIKLSGDRPEMWFAYVY